MGHKRLEQEYFFEIEDSVQKGHPKESVLGPSLFKNLISIIKILRVD